MKGLNIIDKIIPAKDSGERDEMGRLSSSEKKMKIMLQEINQFLTLGVPQKDEKLQDLQDKLRDAFETWSKIPELQEKNDVGEIVLTAYYRQGRIRDYLEKIQTYVGQISEGDDPVLTARMGYNNYVFFLKQYWDELQTEYAAKRDTVKSPAKTVVDDKVEIENVCWYINHECNSVAAIRDLPKARTVGLAYFKAKETTPPPADLKKSFKNALSTVSEAYSLLTAGAKGETRKSDLEMLQKLQKGYTSRISSLNENIEKSQNLYAALAERLTEERFSKLDLLSDETRLSTITTTEIQKLYESFLAQFSDGIFDF